LFRAAIGFLRLFPYRWILHICQNLFVFAGYYLGLRKKVARQQMEMVYPEYSRQQINDLLRSMYRNLGCTVTEIYFATPEYMIAHSRPENFHYVEEALSKGKGLILTTGHFGCWEVAAWILVHYGIPMVAVAKRQRNPYFDAYTLKWREKLGMQVIYKETAGRNLIRALQQNKAITLLIDQNARKDGVLTDFLGHPASTFKGAAKIAMHSHIPIIPCVVIRQPNGEHVFHFDPPLDSSLYPDTEEGVQQLTQDVSLQLEAKIREYPHLWFWVHRRWKGAHYVLKEK
jgi:KDO2-lipid IV(A) lauroyltransferase